MIGSWFAKDARGIRQDIRVYARAQSGEERLHLDLRGDDPAAELWRLVGLGAPVLDEQATWVVLADPEGNEFDLWRQPSPDWRRLIGANQTWEPVPHVAGKTATAHSRTCQLSLVVTPGTCAALPATFSTLVRMSHGWQAIAVVTGVFREPYSRMLRCSCCGRWTVEQILLDGQPRLKVCVVGSPVGYCRTIFEVRQHLESAVFQALEPEPEDGGCE